MSETIKSVFEEFVKEESSASAAKASKKGFLSQLKESALKGAGSVELPIDKSQLNKNFS